jgi:WD40 repeat protein
MGAVFISHSSRDHGEASEVADWLRERGLSSMFLDFDPEHGIPAGRRWERELYARLDACIALVVLCSAASMASKWCFHEIASARARRIPVFPLRLDDCAPIELLRDVQIVDLTVERERGLQRLWRGMLAAGVDPAVIFPIDPARAPYPGLAAFDLEDAGVFFGREGAIRDVRAELDRQRAQGAGRAVLILGASGSGKSSLMRAGVLPRLLRDCRRWLALPPFQPQGALGPLPRLAQVLAAAFEQTGAAVERARLGAVLDGDAQALVELAELLRLAHGHMDAQLLISVDQAEQLLEPDPAPRSAEYLAMLRLALEHRASSLVLLATLRSDRLGAWQSHPALHGLDFASVTVGAMAAEGFRQVIQLPAEAHGLELEPGLVDAIVADIGGNADALPLLAFTLRELWETRRRTADTLTVADYRDELGGVARLIERRADAAVPTDLVPERAGALRRWLISLARPVDDGGYIGRAVPRSSVGPEIADLVGRLIDASLLVSDRQSRPATSGESPEIEVLRVAHEALFRVWPRLRDWLADARQHHAAAERVRVAWQRWQDAGAPADDLLLRPGRELEEARELLSARHVAIDAALRCYIEVSAAAHEAELSERERRRAEAARQQERERAAREEASRQRRDRFALQSRLEVEEGEVTLGLLLALEGLASAAAPGDPSASRLEAALLRAILTQRERRIMAAAAPLNRVIASPDGRSIATLGRDGTATLWDLASGRASHMLEGHRAQLLAGAFSPNGRHFATSSADHTVRIFDVATGEARATLSGHDGAVLDVAWSAEGAVLLTASSDATVRLWSVAGEAVRTLRGHQRDVVCACFAPDGRTILSASLDGTARLWSTLPSGGATVLEGHRAALLRACFSADGARVATASWDGSARLWSTRDGGCLATMDAQSGGLEVAVFTPDGASVVTAGEDGAIRFWNGFDGTPQRTLTGHLGQVFDVGFALDGRCLASCSDDGTVRLWDLASGEALARLSGHAGAVWGQAVSPSGRLLLTASEDATARLWDLTPGRARAVLDGHGGEVYRAAFSPSGRQLATAAQDGIVRLWQIGRETAPVRLEAHARAVWHLAWAPAGRELVSASEDGVARLWDVATGACRLTLRGHRGWVGHAVFSPAGDLIATCGEDATAILWDTGSGAEIRRFAGHAGLLRQVLFLPDGRRLATASDDGTARIWEIADGRCTAVLGGHTGAVVALAVTPDGATVATASLDRTAALHDAASGALRHSLSGHRNQVWHIAFDADGTRVVTASHDNRAMLWDVTSGKALAALTGHRGRVVDAAFDPTGRLLATASWDRTARLWHAASGQHVATLLGHRGRLNAGAFSPDGRQLVTTSADGSARLFELPIGPGDDWATHARSIAPRPLGDSERRLYG